MLKSIPVHGMCDPRFMRVQEIFAAALESGEEIGAAVSFVLDGDIVVDLWGGYRDEDRTQEWTRDTLVNVFSATKGMTAICAHQLIERGLLELEAPVARYWPEFAASGKEGLLVRWLLNHKAGLCAIGKPLPIGAFYDWQLMCDALAEQEPWWEPGTDHGYHAFTFGFLVGELVRRVTGASIGTFFRRNVAEPLGADFHIGVPEADDARVATVYGVAAGNRPMPTTPPPAGPFEEVARAMRDPSTMQHKTVFNPPQATMDVNTRKWRAAEIPSVNGHGSAAGIARIYGALARGGEIDGVRILSHATIERAIAEEAYGPDRFTIGVPSRYGLGFQLSHGSSEQYARFSPNPRAFGHTGAGGSLGMADPDAKLACGFTMNNLHPGIVAPTAAAMIDAFYAALGDSGRSARD
jgi:CubicO group peptidase (beta-lactamase class C family)